MEAVRERVAEACVETVESYCCGSFPTSTEVAVSSG